MLIGRSRAGMCPGTALGFFWALGGMYQWVSPVDVLIHSGEAAAERRELYRFSADLGKLALRLADQYGSNHEKWCVCFVLDWCGNVTVDVRISRALLLFCPLVSGYDSAHFRTNIPRLEQALKFGQSAGDR